MTHTREQISHLKRWQINIQFCDRGCMVQIGCKSFAFESIEQAMAELTAYAKDPIGVGKKYAPEEFVDLKETCVSESAPIGVHR